MKKHKIVDLIGSTDPKNRFAFRSADAYFTLKGYIVLAPSIFKDSLAMIKSVHDSNKIDKIDKNLHDLCTEKLSMADIVCIINKDHIGKSTKDRIKQAIKMKKKVLTYDWLSDTVHDYKGKI